MGIPLVQALLQPYATTINFPLQSHHDQDQQQTHHQPTSPISQIIIDGPALAYHALAIATAKLQSKVHFSRNLAAAAQQRHKNIGGDNFRDVVVVVNDVVGSVDATKNEARRAIPSYQAITNAIIAWLDALLLHANSSNSSSEVEVTLYFDGGLPGWKKGVRVERMRKLVKQLEECRFVFPDLREELGCEDTSGCDDGAEGYSLSNLFDFRTSSQRDIKFPAPPAFVPAVFEGLRSSQYADRVTIVPGEADAFCASSARKHAGSIVITSDSDLMISDLGATGRVMLIKEFGLAEVNDIQSIRGRVYQPNAIAKSLKLKNLLPLGFAIKHDRFKSFNSQVRYANKVESDASEEYKAFLVEYPDVTQQTIPILHNRSLRQTFQQLDTIAELVTQFFTPETQSDQLGSWDFYLPQFHEDPRRASAHAYGLDIRQTAYSLLAHLSHREINTVAEYHRKGNQLGEVQIAVKSLAETTEALSDLSHQLAEAVKDLSLGSGAPCWQDLGFYWLLCKLKEDDKLIPRRDQLELIYCGRVRHSWDLMHYFAQMQGILFAWRVLTQCLLCHITICSVTAVEACEGAEALYNSLGKIAGASYIDMFDSILLENFDRERWQMLLYALYELLDIVEEEPAKVKKKKKKTTQGNNTLQRAKKTANMFDILARQ